MTISEAIFLIRNEILRPDSSFTCNLNYEAATLLKKNEAEFYKKAKEWTQKYAI